MKETDPPTAQRARPPWNDSAAPATHTRLTISAGLARWPQVRSKTHWSRFGGPRPPWWRGRAIRGYSIRSVPHCTVPAGSTRPSGAWSRQSQSKAATASRLDHILLSMAHAGKQAGVKRPAGGWPAQSPEMSCRVGRSRRLLRPRHDTPGTSSLNSSCFGGKLRLSFWPLIFPPTCLRTEWVPPDAFRWADCRIRPLELVPIPLYSATWRGRLARLGLFDRVRDPAPGPVLIPRLVVLEIVATHDTIPLSLWPRERPVCQHHTCTIPNGVGAVPGKSARAHPVDLDPNRAAQAS